MISPEHGSSSARVAETVLSVEGMDCASCAARVEKALRGAGGVEWCAVNLAAGRALVRFDPQVAGPADFVRAVNEAGYQASLEPAPASAAAGEHRRFLQQQQHAAQWLRRALIGLALWVPVEAIHWGMYLAGAEHKALLHWLAAASGTLALVLVGGGFYRQAAAALRRGTSNMDTLIAMGATVAWLYSAVAFGGHLAGWWRVLPALYFTEASALLALISLGHWLEARARLRAGAAIRELLNLAPATALLVDDQGSAREIPVAAVQVGDRFLVRPGDRIPVDGVVVEGESLVDESMLTGESMPVAKKPGDALSAGTANHNGRLIVRATRVGADTALAQIVQLVEHAQSTRPPVQRLADRVAAVFVPAVLLVALATGVGWYVAGTLSGWHAARTWATIANAVCSVLIIACPCALGLAVPAALMVGLGRGASRGILIRDIDAIQHAESVDIVVFDKTGTITEGKPAVVAVRSLDGNMSDEQVLRLAAAAEQYSEHPLAAAIVRKARESGLDIPDCTGFASEAGLGVRAEVEGLRVIVGSETVVRAAAESAPDPPAAGRTRVWVALDDAGDSPRPVGFIELHDPPRSDAPLAVAELHRMGLRTMLLTGDNEAAALAVARSVGIDEVRAGVPPAGKAEVIAALRRQGVRVAMAGDGINDAPALAAADLGIAIGSGSDVAKETGGIVLAASSLRGIPTAIRLSRLTMRKIRQNLFFAFFYNVVAIPLAAAGLLSPAIAAAAMAMSDVTVIGNALLLRRARID